MAIAEHPMRNRALGAAALLAAASALGTAAAGARSATPRPAGDWESVSGTPATFELGTSGRGRRRTSWLVDLTVLARATCTTASGKDVQQPPQPLLFPTPIRINRGHVSSVTTSAFGQVRLTGSVRAGRSAQLRVDERQVAFGQTCSDHTASGLAPGRRVAVEDGTWRGAADDGEPVLFNVRGGGRIIVIDIKGPCPSAFSSFAIGTWTCPTSNGTTSLVGQEFCAATVDDYMYVEPDGTFTDPGAEPVGDQPEALVHGRFLSATTATGVWSEYNKPGGCDMSWSVP